MDIPAPVPTQPLATRRWHRTVSVTVAVPLIFFAVTGIALNHRKAFDYFRGRSSESRPVATRDGTAVREFLEFYKAEIGRDDDPAVIRIKGERSIEFLYGSHGQTIFTIDPVAGRLTRTVTANLEPWTTVNRLHTAFKTPAAWAWASDLLALAMIGSILTGVCLPGVWRRSWRSLLFAAGISLLLFYLAARGAA